MLVFVGPLHFGIQYTGLKLATDIAPMVVAMQLWAPASVVFAALLLKERVGRCAGQASIVAFLGTASMNFDPAVFAQGWALFSGGVGVAFLRAWHGAGARLGGGLDPLGDASLDRAGDRADDGCWRFAYV